MLWKLIELMIVVGGLMTVARIFYTEWKGKEVGDILTNTLLVLAICVTVIGLVDTSTLPFYVMSAMFIIFLLGNVFHIRGKETPGKWMAMLSGVLLMIAVAVISLEQGFGPMSFALTMAIGITLGLGAFSTSLLLEEDATVLVVTFAAFWVTYTLFVENEAHTMFASVIATILLGVYLREKRVVHLIAATQLLGLGYLLLQFFAG